MVRYTLRELSATISFPHGRVDDDASWQMQICHELPDLRLPAGSPLSGTTPCQADQRQSFVTTVATPLKVVRSLALPNAARAPGPPRWIENRLDTWPLYQGQRRHPPLPCDKVPGRVAAGGDILTDPPSDRIVSDLRNASRTPHHTPIGPRESMFDDRHAGRPWSGRTDADAFPMQVAAPAGDGLVVRTVFISVARLLGRHRSAAIHMRVRLGIEPSNRGWIVESRQ